MTDSFYDILTTKYAYELFCGQYYQMNPKCTLILNESIP